RALRGGHYPGLAELIGDFYASVTANTMPPLSPVHLDRVAAIYERLAAAIHGAAPRRPSTAIGADRDSPVAEAEAPLAVLTGARGFLGKQIARALAERGYRVRGLGRAADREDVNVHEWRVL